MLYSMAIKVMELLHIHDIEDIDYGINLQNDATTDTLKT